MTRLVSKLGVVTAALSLCLATPAQATFHIIVIEEVFPGLPEAPAAQFLTVRLQAPLQIAVYGQPFPVYDAAGTAEPNLATFCSTPRAACSLPTVSLACKAGGCPSPFDIDGSRILVATTWAQGLFCVTPDVLATGTIPFPSGRVCFGECGPRSDCAEGPVDCVAYGNFTGDNGIFGAPAAALLLGSALVASPQRTNQFIGGNLLDSAAGFSMGAPEPRNLHGDLGAFTGQAGDANGDAAIDDADVAALGVASFAGGTRCDLSPASRGADTNVDTRVGAADLVSLIQLRSL